MDETDGSAAETFVRLTPRARKELPPGEALVFDWVRLSFCCAVAGEVSLRLTSRREAEESRRYVPLGRDPDVPLYSHRRAYPHLTGRTIEVDCRRRFGVRRFTSDLPADLGLRAILGRAPAGRFPRERS